MNDRFKRDSPQAGHREHKISGCDGKIPVVVTTAVPRASLIPFVSGRLSQLVCLGLQQFIDSSLYVAPTNSSN